MFTSFFGCFLNEGVRRNSKKTMPENGTEIRLANVQKL